MMEKSSSKQTDMHNSSLQRIEVKHLQQVR